VANRVWALLSSLNIIDCNYVMEIIMRGASRNAMWRKTEKHLSLLLIYI
jgi:hypothetical protein